MASLTGARPIGVACWEGIDRDGPPYPSQCGNHSMHAIAITHIGIGTETRKDVHVASSFFTLTLSPVQSGGQRAAALYCV
eukprot:scaffold10803_cov133-Isochrysis_galbana.AAC.7